MEQNPFAPPTSAPPPEEAGLVFSAEGVEVVSSLAKWMRGLSIFYYICIGLLGIGSCGMMATAGFADGMSMVIVGIIIGLTVLCAATIYLREAASGFERGVYSDDEMTLGAGFRSLRVYLIIFGVIGIVSMVSTLLDHLG